MRRPGVGRRPTGRSAYLTYPAQPGITVTHSRGISPHSARPSDRADRPIHMLFYAGQTLPAEIVCDNRSIAQVSFYCKGGTVYLRPHRERSGAIIGREEAIDFLPPGICC